MKTSFISFLSPHMESQQILDDEADPVKPQSPTYIFSRSGRRDTSTASSSTDKGEVNEPQQTVNGRTSASFSARGEEPNQLLRTSNHKKNGNNHPEDDVSRGSIDQVSTQSSAGDSSELAANNGSTNPGKNNINDARNTDRSRRKDDGAYNSSSGITMDSSTTTDPFEVSSAGGVVPMVKHEELITASSAEPAPDRAEVQRNGSSRKSVRILEPSTGSIGRLSSDHSLGIEDTEDFFIDRSSINTSGNGRNDISGAGLDDSDGSIAHHFFHVLTADPSRDKNGDKNQHHTVLWKIRLICGKIVENPHVQLGIILLIVVNAVFMGIGTFDFVTDNPDVDKGFNSLDKAFLIVFTIELVLQLMYRSFSYFTDSWLVFDFVIVVISWSLESLQVVRAFRIFRAFRLVTRIGPLRELIMAIGEVMPRMYAIAMLLLLIFYIFAVLFTELFRDVHTEVNYFRSLDRSLFTCMELMTLEWASVAREVMEQKSWAWAPFLAFISVTGFIVFNLIVAVVCDAVAVVDREVHAERLGDFETDTTKLEKAQERIWDMTDHIERMLESQRALEEVILKLNGEMEELTGRRTGIVPFRRPSLRRLSTVSKLPPQEQWE